jgi:hypothetical protein
MINRINGIGRVYRKEFKGKIKYIQMFDENPYKIIISIDDGSEFEISYGVTCVDDDFNNFVTIGDSVMKQKGTKLGLLRRIGGIEFLN